ncbi:SUZ12 [Lepeophtheirus salmonis]|uniref:SUZ12 n=1 Tax=Lepeophtheirus salmonis TaxID=72036 RepID=A0A7R8GYY4_LEPSM|nr:SUZ12 [Lepeophtheirus salmonis]CAF2754849.1 SUZ12 [Lepeophtheirus salmonis]
MGPKVKKAPQNGGSNVNEKKDLEQIQADYELFLQAFEKPTQIYRYLRTRNLISPIFLHRNLSFMQKKRYCRRKESHVRSRTEFKVDSLLERKYKELRLSSSMLLPPNAGPSSYLLLTFLGYYFDEEEEDFSSSPSKMTTEVFLVKTSHRHRAESHDSSIKVPFGVVEVPVNPNVFRNMDNGHQLQNYTLLFNVNPKLDIKMTNGSRNSDKLDADENTEPLCKRRKSNCIDSDENETSNSCLRRSADLVIYDKHSKCLLSDGEYEVVLSSSSLLYMGVPRIGRKTLLMHFLSNPTLKFKLSWSSDKTGSLIQRPRPLLPRGDDNNSCRSNGYRPPNNKNYFSSSSLNNGVKSEKRSDKKKQTEARDDLHCPWCSLNCMELYALLKHLKLSHPRFLFTYVPIPEGARIDVSVSELYDSTYVGNPHDMIRQPPGFAFSRRVPTQRTSVTNVIVCKPKRPLRNSLSEFLEIDDNDLNGPYDGQRPFVTGHNRLYHYSTTCLAMPPNAILEPLEEDQVDPPWLMIKICKMLDEFSDVNDGEKEFMKMWNLHVQHHTYVGDIQVNLALEMFFRGKFISSSLALQTIVKIQNLIKLKGQVIGAHEPLLSLRHLPSSSALKEPNSSPLPSQRAGGNDHHKKRMGEKVKMKNKKDLDVESSSTSSNNSSKKKKEETPKEDGIRKDFSGLFNRRKSQNSSQSSQSQDLEPTSTAESSFSNNIISKNQSQPIKSVNKTTTSSSSSVPASAPSPHS